ncbi:MAG: formate dehydrogenase accessory sulfurtransferase FdhD, partial [Nocardioides sp.]
MNDRARRPGPTVRVSVREVTTDGERRREDRLATEEPLEIRLGWPGAPARRLWVTMRTPGHDFELAAGFLLHEGLVGRGDIRTVAYCTDTDLTPEQ